MTKRLILSLILCPYLLINAQNTAFNLPQGPYGGGEWYDGVVTDPENYFHVSSYEGLKLALENGNVKKIYIDDGSIIDIPYNESIHIKRDDLIIAGGRGKYGVRLSKIRRLSNLPIHQTAIIINAKNVRITGLILEGPERLCIPEKDIGDTNLTPFVINGVGVWNSKGVEIDNCVIMNWTGSGVNISGNESNNNSIIHHNIFYNNNSDYWSSNSSFGYGVSLGGVDVNVVLAYNLFENNRHAIAGSSFGGESYMAQYNCVIPNSKNERKDHSFDMHGFYDRFGYPNARCLDPKSVCNYAGSIISIENNYFESLREDQYGILIRGIPKVSALVNKNFFEASGINEGVVQQFFPCSLSDSNCNTSFQETNPKKQLNIQSADNLFSQDITYFNVSWEGKTNGKLISPFVWDINEVKVGDFDGDGVDDLFRISENQFLVSSKGSGNWTVWKELEETVEELIFADFNNDGKTDVLTSKLGKWYLSTAKSGKQEFGSWLYMGDLGFGVEHVVVGDFDNNGFADLYRLTDDVAYCAYSFGGMFNDWQLIESNLYPIDKIHVYDFNGDNYDDLIVNDSGDWKVCYSSNEGFQAWENVCSLNIGVSNFYLADFDGNGYCDLLYNQNQKSFIAYSNGLIGAFSIIEEVNNFNNYSSELLIGDFNGIGKMDVAYFSDNSFQDIGYSVGDGANILNVSNKSVIEKEEAYEVILYPNPLHNQLFIKCNMSIDKVEIFNVTGERIKSVEKVNSSIDLESFTNGYYLVHVIIGKQRLIKGVIKN